MTLKIPFYKDKKRIAWLVWALLKNNKFSKHLFYIVTLCEYCSLYFFVLMIGIQYDQENDGSGDGNMARSQGLAHILYNAQLSQQYKNLYLNEQLLMLTTYIIAGFYLIILLIALFLVIYFDSPIKASSPNFFAKILSIMVIVQSKLFFTIEVWVVVSAFALQTNSETYFTMVVLNTLNVIMMLIVDFFLFKLFNVRVKNQMIVWGQVNNIHYYCLMALKCFLASAHLIDSVKTKIALTSIFTLATQSLVLYILPIYDQYFMRFKLFLGQILFIMNLTFLLYIYLEVKGYMIEIAIIFSILSYSMIELVIWIRKRDLQQRYYRHELKGESDIERFLLHYINCLENYEKDKDSQRQLLEFLWHHKNNCFRLKDCVCYDMFKFEIEEQNSNEDDVTESLPFNSTLIQTNGRNQIGQINVDLATILDVDKPFDNGSQLNSASQQLDIHQKYLKPQSMAIQDSLSYRNLNYLFSFQCKNYAEGNKKNGFSDSKIKREQNCPIQNIDQIMYEMGLDKSDYHIKTFKIILLLLYEMIKEQDMKFDFKNQKIIQMRAYFELEHLKNKFLCHSSITRLSQLNLGLLNMIMMLIDSQYLLEKAKQAYIDSEVSNIDMPKVIDQNLVLYEYFQINDEISSVATQFWSRLSSDSNDLESLYKEGIAVAQLIDKIMNKFEEIQSKNKRNYQIYYHQACFQKYILNNDVLCNLYLQKMEQLRELKIAIKNKYKEDSILTDSDESGFIIVKASFKEFGQIMFINRTCSQWLGYENNYLVQKSINCMMPTIVAESHHKFWKKFNDFGVPSFIEREQHLFMKRSDGYVIPVLAYVKFNHDKHFGHTFMAIVNKACQMTPFKNQKKYNPHELMIVITDEKNHIIEVNETVNEILGINSAFVEQNSRYISDALKIDQVFEIESFDFDRTTQIESTCGLNSTFASSLANEKLKSFDQSNLQTLTDFTAVFQSKNMMSIKMMTQNYKEGILIVKYFFIGLNDLQFEIMKNLETENDTNKTGGTLMLENLNLNDDDMVSMGSTTTVQDGKEIQNLIDTGKTPRMLKLVLQLVTLCFIIMITISITNLVQFLSTEKKAHTQIDVTHQVMDRLVYTSKALILMQCFLSLKQKKPNEKLYKATLDIFNIQNSNFTILEGLLIDKIIKNIDLIKEKQYIIDQNYGYFTESKLIKDMKDQKLIPVWSISRNGQAIQQNQTLTTAMNLFVQSGQAIVSFPFNQNYQTRGIVFDSLETQFRKILNRSFTNTSIFTSEVIDLEQQIYQFYKTGIYKIKELNFELADAYRNETLKQFDGNKNLALMLMLISVSSIFVIILAVLPNFSKIENRKYQVLSFFFLLQEDIVKVCQERSNVFEEQFYDKFEIEEEDVEMQLYYQKFKKVLRTHIQKRNQPETKRSNGMLKSKTFRKSDTENEGYQTEESQDNIMMEIQLSQKIDIAKLNQIRRKEMMRPKISEINDVHFTFQKLHSKHLNFRQSINQFPLINQQASKKSSSSQSIADEHPKDSDKKVAFASEDMNRSLGNSRKRKSKFQLFPQKYNDHNHRQIQSNEDQDRNSAKEMIKSASSDKKLQNDNNWSFKKDSSSPSNSIDQYEEENKAPTIVQGSRNQINKRKVALNQPGDSTKNMANRISFRKKRSRRVDSSSNSQEEITSSESEDEIQMGFDTFQNPNNPFYPDPQESVNVKQQQDEDDHKEKKDKIISRIKSISSRGRVRVAITLLLLGLMFSSYFIAIFILSIKTFDDIYFAVSDLDSLYKKSSCQTQLFIQYRNEILMNIEPKLLETQAQIEKCLTYERAYLEIKRQDRGYFSKINKLFKELDSSLFCDRIQDNLIDSSDKFITKESCLRVYNSVFKKGLSYASQIIIKAVQFDTIIYKSISMSSRNQTFMENMYEEVDILTFIYTKEFLIDVQMIKILQDAETSIISYLESISKAYVIVFSMMCILVFIALILFFFVIYKRMKNIMMDCNTLLRILPISYLDSETHEHLKKFIFN